jgi:ribose transport system substrate-binding protein
MTGKDDSATASGACPRRSSNRREFLRRAGAVGVVAGVAGCTQATGGGGGDGTYTIGFAGESLRDAFKTALKRTTELYVTGNGHEVRSTNAEGDASQQSQQARNMLNAGVDALVLDPVSDAATAIVDRATEQDVPVFTMNGTVNSADVRSYVALGNEIAGYQAGKALAERVGQYSDGTGRLFEVQGSQGTVVGVQRSEGFNRAIDEEDGVEVVGQVSSENWSQEDVASKTTSFLQRDSDVDGVYTAWGLAGVGVLTALDRQGMKHERGADGYVPIATIDSIPIVLENIRKGFFEVAVGQPVPFYPALTLELVWSYLDAGKDESVLPETGSELTAADVDVGVTEDVEVNPWQDESGEPYTYWSPAEVVTQEADGDALYPFVKTQALEVTPENVDAPYLWGNLDI